MKRVGLIIVLASVFLFGLMIQSYAGGMKLHLAHWNPPKDPNTKVLQLIAKDIQEASNGTITSEISWQAFGKPGDYYSALTSGLCDIACFGPTYSPGIFPITEMMTLPICYPKNRTTVLAYYKMWKKGYLDKEFKKFQVLAFGNNSSFLFMWGKKPYTTLSEIKNKKVSGPYSIHTEMIEAAGATPVSMPVTEVYSALDTGVIDGSFQIWPAMPIFRLHEVVKYATDISMSCGPYVIAVNKDVYNKFPDKVKQVLNKNIEKYSLMMADGFQHMTDIGLKMFLDNGGKLSHLSKEDKETFMKACRPIFDKWIKNAKKRGLPAEKALDDLYNILVDLGVEKPFVR